MNHLQKRLANSIEWTINSKVFSLKLGPRYCSEEIVLQKFLILDTALFFLNNDTFMGQYI